MNCVSDDNLMHEKYKTSDFAFEGPFSPIRCLINFYFFSYPVLRNHIFLIELWHLYRSATGITDKFDILGALCLKLLIELCVVESFNWPMCSCVHVKNTKCLGSRSHYLYYILELLHPEIVFDWSIGIA